MTELDKLKRENAELKKEIERLSRKGKHTQPITYGEILEKTGK
jgi:cell division protein FtsB